MFPRFVLPCIGFVSTALLSVLDSYCLSRSKWLLLDRRHRKIPVKYSPYTKVLLAAIPQRVHRILSDLRSKSLRGPVSTEVGDRSGSPPGTANFLRHF